MAFPYHGNNRIDGLGQLSTALYVDAVRIDLGILDFVAFSSLTSSQQCLIASATFVGSVFQNVLESKLLRTLSMRQNGVGRNLPFNEPLELKRQILMRYIVSGGPRGKAERVQRGPKEI